MAFFTNEEGALFHLTWAVRHQGSFPEAALTTTDKEGASVESELARIGYLGQTPVNSLRPRAFQLHVEQGPVSNNAMGHRRGDGVQGISTEYQIRGTESCGYHPDELASRWGLRRRPLRSKRAHWQAVWAEARLPPPGLFL